MRIHEGNFAYDIEQTRDPLTQLPLKWKYTIFRLRPVEQVITSSEAESFAAAERRARRAVAKLVASHPRAA